MGINKILITQEQIATRLQEMGDQITRDYAGKEILIVCLLKGAFMMMADLARHIRLPVEFDYIAASSYGDEVTSSGVVRILKDLDVEIAGRHVIVVEDIVDTGLTLDYLLNILRLRNPASLEVAALLLKEGIQERPINARYVAFKIGQEFVIGYGLDFAQQYRELPYIGIYQQEGVS